MSKLQRPPAFLFYVDDFCSDGKVEAMTTEEVGAYILLLCKAWREDPPGTIPNDDRILARWTRLDADRWAACKPAVLAAFSLGTDSRWHQKRMRQEFERLTAHNRKRHDAASTAARARWDQIHANGNANAMRDACESHSERNAILCISSSSSSSDEEESFRKTHSDFVASEKKHSQPSAIPKPEVDSSPLDLPPGFPQSPDEAKSHAAFAGVTPEFAESVYHAAHSTGGRDKHGNPIRSFRSYLKVMQAGAASRKEERKIQANGKPQHTAIARKVTYKDFL